MGPLCKCHKKNSFKNLIMWMNDDRFVWETNIHKIKEHKILISEGWHVSLLNIMSYILL